VRSAITAGGGIVSKPWGDPLGIDHTLNMRRPYPLKIGMLEDGTPVTDFPGRAWVDGEELVLELSEDLARAFGEYFAFHPQQSFGTVVLNGPTSQVRISREGSLGWMERHERQRALAGSR
jgi:hypothetical protein